MPIIFENELEQTIDFIKKWSNGINVIIPHLGFGSRSYNGLRDAGIWDKENVYTDTSFS